MDAFLDILYNYFTDEFSFQLFIMVDRSKYSNFRLIIIYSVSLLVRYYMFH